MQNILFEILRNNDISQPCFKNSSNMSYPKKNCLVVKNFGKSQNKLLEGPDHKSTCFSAQDPVF